MLLRMLIALKAVSDAAAAKPPAPVQPSLQLPQRPSAQVVQQGGGQAPQWSTPQPAGDMAAATPGLSAAPPTSPPPAIAQQQQRPEQSAFQSPQPQPQLQLPASLVQQLLRSPVTPLTQAPPPLPFTLGSPGVTPTSAAAAAAAAAAATPAGLDGNNSDTVAGSGSMPHSLDDAAGGMGGIPAPSVGDMAMPSFDFGGLGFDLGSAEDGGPAFPVPLWSPADVLPATLGTGVGSGLEGLPPLPPLPPGMELPPLPGMPGGAPLMPDGLPPMYRTRAPRSEWVGRGARLGLCRARAVWPRGMNREWLVGCCPARTFHATQPRTSPNFPTHLSSPPTHLPPLASCREARPHHAGGTAHHDCVRRQRGAGARGGAVLVLA